MSAIQIPGEQGRGSKKRQHGEVTTIDVQKRQIIGQVIAGIKDMVVIRQDEGNQALHREPAAMREPQRTQFCQTEIHSLPQDKRL